MPKLNLDCIRDILKTIELIPHGGNLDFEKIAWNEEFRIQFKNIAVPTPELLLLYSSDELKYHLFFLKDKHIRGSTNSVYGLTVAGYALLNQFQLLHKPDAPSDKEKILSFL